jgi:hypothetical protein
MDLALEGPPINSFNIKCFQYNIVVVKFEEKLQLIDKIREIYCAYNYLSCT